MKGEIIHKEQRPDGIVYHFDKSQVFIVAPTITEEEREHRLEEIKKLIFHLLYSKSENYN